MAGPSFQTVLAWVGFLDLKALDTQLGVLVGENSVAEEAPALTGLFLGYADPEHLLLPAMEGPPLLLPWEGSQGSQKHQEGLGSAKGAQILVSMTAVQTCPFLDDERPLKVLVLQEHKVQGQQGLEGHCPQNLAVRFVPTELWLGSHISQAPGPWLRTSCQAWGAQYPRVALLCVKPVAQPLQWC